MANGRHWRFRNAARGGHPCALPISITGAPFLGLLVDAGHGSGGGQADLGESDVERLPLVVERGRLQDDARRPHQHGHREDPQEEPVEHHRHVLPVLDDLRCKRSSLALIHAIQ